MKDLIITALAFTVVFLVIGIIRNESSHKKDDKNQHWFVEEVGPIGKDEHILECHYIPFLTFLADESSKREGYHASFYEPDLRTGMLSEAGTNLVITTSLLPVTVFKNGFYHTLFIKQEKLWSSDHP